MTWGFMMDKIKFRKAKVTIVNRYATIESENGATFQLPSAFVTPEEVFHLDEGDDVLIYIEEGHEDIPPVILVVPYMEGGLSITLKPDDGEYLIEEIRMITKEDLDDL